MSTGSLLLHLLLSLPPRSDLVVGRTLGRFEIGRSSIKQVVATCRRQAPRAVAAKEPGEGSPLSITTRLPDDGCVVWRAGALGGWDTITSVVITSQSDLCTARFACSVASVQATEWLELLGQAPHHAWKPISRDVALLEQERLHEPTRVGNDLRHLFELVRARTERGRCVHLERAVVVEAENPLGR